MIRFDSGAYTSITSGSNTDLGFDSNDIVAGEV